MVQLQGYAVDEAIDVLKKLGIKEALVNAGGEISVIGYDWIVGIQHPREINSIIKKIKPNGYTVATSGDYEQYFEVDGKDIITYLILRPVIPQRIAKVLR
ncbi:MAG: FAD:protein FMN transferase [Ignavibacteriales bacterium]|nr:FAD:protein FMN transferase [Ignavibacteriales bacterium]